MIAPERVAAGPISLVTDGGYVAQVTCAKLRWARGWLLVALGVAIWLRLGRAAAAGGRPFGW